MRLSQQTAPTILLNSEDHDFLIDDLCHTNNTMQQIVSAEGTSIAICKRPSV